MPREYRRTGGMNYVDFWSHLPDPIFEFNKLSEHGFIGVGGASVQARAQLFWVNRTFKKEEHREVFLAIEAEGEITEFPLPLDSIGLPPFWSNRVIFISQSNDTLFYFFNSFQTGDSFVSGIIAVGLPLVRKKLTVTTENSRIWAQLLESAKNADVQHSRFQELCQNRDISSHAFAEQTFGIKCR